MRMPTLDELLRMSKADRDAAADRMPLGELLALVGYEIEVERDGATPEEIARLTRLISEARKPAPPSGANTPEG